MARTARASQGGILYHVLNRGNGRVLGKVECPPPFSIAPLMMAWVAYGIADSAAIRMAVLVGWLVAERYTYGLNLGDAFFATAALVAWEGWGKRGFRRWLTLLVAVLPAAAGVVFWRQLCAFVEAIGAAYTARIPYLLAGEALLSAFLAIAPRFARSATRSTAGRLAYFAAVNGFINVGLQVLWLVAGLPVGYYFYRYHLLACVLLVAAAVALGPLALPHWRAHRSRKIWRTMGGLLLVGLITLGSAFPRHQDSFLERMLKGPPFRHLKPLADREGLTRVQYILYEQKKVCRAVLAPFWPTVFFMNASSTVRELNIEWRRRESVRDARSGPKVHVADPAAFSRATRSARRG